MMSWFAGRTTPRSCRRCWIGSGARTASALALALTALTACAGGPSGPRQTVTTGEWCQLDEPLSYSASEDTAQTVKEIIAHNEAWCEVCDDQHPFCKEAANGEP